MIDTISAIFPRGKRRTAAAQQALANAYASLFSGHGDRSAAEIVLADLAKASGYFQTLPPNDASGDALWHANGQRALMNRILQYTTLPPEAMADLLEAARLEAAVDREEGQEL